MVRRVEKTPEPKTPVQTKKAASMGAKPVAHLDKKAAQAKGSAKMSRELLDTSSKAKHVVRNAFNNIKALTSVKVETPIAQTTPPSKREMKDTKKVFKQNESTLAKLPKRRGR